MSKFFDLFPTVAYDINAKKQLKYYNNVTNVFFRLRVIREVLSNSTTYYEHLVKEGDTPEILADKVYGDTEAHWIILLANDILDPQYDWPLGYRDFRNYMYKKYFETAEKSKLQSITISNPGSGYSNGYITFSGGSGINANARIKVNATGSIVDTDIINVGSKYRVIDDVHVNVSHLGGSNANLSVILTKPTVSEVISWTQDTTNPNSVYRYEKVIERTESFSGLVTETRFGINEKPFSNVYYKAENTVEILLTDIEGAFFKNSTANVGQYFIGTVTEYEPSNGYIKLVNSSGYFYKNDKLDSGYVFASASNGVISTVISPTPSLELNSSVPYETYEYIPESGFFETFNMGYQGSNTTNTLFNANRTVSQRTSRNLITYYDWEVEENENKRSIKIIKPEYYNQIVREFKQLTNNSDSPFIRRLRV